MAGERHILHIKRALPVTKMITRAANRRLSHCALATSTCLLSAQSLRSTANSSFSSVSSSVFARPSWPSTVPALSDLASNASPPRRNVHFSASSSRPLRHITKITSLTKEEIVAILQLATHIRSQPHSYTQSLAHHTLLMLFSKPSLRTRLSFEAGMTQLGGHAIYYPLDANAPLGQKESIEDTAIVSSRYADLIMMRVQSRQTIADYAAHATVPVINALDDFAHPCQILADLLTLHQQHPQLSYDFSKLKLAYIGDIANNVTYDLMRVAALFGAEFRACGPIQLGDKFKPEQAVVEECQQIARQTGAKLTVTGDVSEAAAGANAIVTDTWHSYHLSKSESGERERVMSPYRVTEAVMRQGAPGCVFLHCLPAQRGVEVTAGVIDGEWSVVYDEAENRLHAQKALMLWLLGKGQPVS